MKWWWWLWCKTRDTRSTLRSNLTHLQYVTWDCWEHPKGEIIGTWDIWDADYNTDNWEPGLMTIFVTWQLIVTLDSIRNSCDVLWTTLTNHTQTHILHVKNIWVLASKILPNLTKNLKEFPLEALFRFRFCKMGPNLKELPLEALFSREDFPWVNRPPPKSCLQLQLSEFFRL